MASALATSTPNRWFQSRKTDTDDNIEAIERLQRRADKLSNTYDGLTRQVVKIERRFERYSLSVRNKNDVIDALTSLKNHPYGPSSVSILVRAMQKLFLTVHEFVDSLDLNSPDSRSIDNMDTLDQEPPLPTPSKSYSSTTTGGFSLRKLLSHAQASIVGIHRDNGVKILTDALMERFDFSLAGVSYLKELFEFCGRPHPKSVNDVWRPLACDIKTCLEYVTEDTSCPADLCKVLTTALRLSIDNVSEGCGDHREEDTKLNDGVTDLAKPRQQDCQEGSILNGDPEDVTKTDSVKEEQVMYIENAAKGRSIEMEIEKHYPESEQNLNDTPQVENKKALFEEQQLKDGPTLDDKSDAEATIEIENKFVIEQKERQILGTECEAANGRDLMKQQSQDEQSFAEQRGAKTQEKQTVGEVEIQKQSDQEKCGTFDTQHDVGRPTGSVKQQPKRQALIIEAMPENGTYFVREKSQNRQQLKAEQKPEQGCGLSEQESPKIEIKPHGLVPEKYSDFVKRQPQKERLSDSDPETETVAESSVDFEKQQPPKVCVLDPEPEANLEKDLELIRNKIASLRISPRHSHEN